MSGQRVVPIQPPSGPYIVPDYPPSCHTVNTWSNGHQEVIKGPKNWCQMVRYLPTAQVSLERWKINTLYFMSGWCDYWKCKRHSLFCNEKNKQLISFLKALFGLYFWSIYRVFFPSQNLLPHRPLSGFNFFRFSKLWIFLYFFSFSIQGICNLHQCQRRLFTRGYWILRLFSEFILLCTTQCKIEFTYQSQKPPKWS